VLVLLFLLACSSDPVAPVSLTVDQLVQVPSSRPHRTHLRLDGGAVVLRDTRWELRAAPHLERPPDLPGELAESVMVQHQDGVFQVETRKGLLIGPQGVFIIGTWSQGAWTDEEPVLDLPATLTTGDTWTREQRLAGRHGTRSCAVRHTPFCEVGVAVECLARVEADAYWSTRHYCAGGGWVGHEMVVVRAGDPPLETWTSGIGADGLPGSSPPKRKRPTPRPDELRRGP